MSTPLPSLVASPPPPPPPHLTPHPYPVPTLTPTPAPTADPTPSPTPSILDLNPTHPFAHPLPPVARMFLQLLQEGGRGEARSGGGVWCYGG